MYVTQECWVLQGLLLKGNDGSAGISDVHGSKLKGQNATSACKSKRAHVFVKGPQSARDAVMD